MNDNPRHPGDTSLVVCPDGPILVRGDFDILTPSGEAVPRHRQTIALCRCGASAIKPYCDGTHKLINFRTDSPASAESPAAAGPPPVAKAATQPEAEVSPPSARPSK
ncbi:CDGSH iron-sulfur domain-containing protein [Arthrobacter sp. ISL-85]|nr:CDGSH iron-sulfur domain-containing protein [Arthrobacter sp. ISL-85]